MAKPKSKAELETYRAKRSADTTAEPFGGALSGDSQPVGEPRLFVCQMHAATRLHWDLRLEIDGVLRSWAVPRGPSFDPKVKRLAVETEDHPIEYVDYEGVIPEGNYGAGAMIVWDRGVWIPLEPVNAGYTAGKLLFELQGHKLRGVWTLVRTKEAGGKSWLLIKKPDGAAGLPEPPRESILSGLTVEELASGNDRAERIRNALQELGVERQRVDARKAELMHAETRDDAFSRPDWVFELKYDGYRLLGWREDGELRLRYRSGREATHAFPEIAQALSRLPFSYFVVDGEVCVLDEDARPNFQRLQKRALLLHKRDVERATREHPVTMYAFDLLGFEDFDLRPRPLLERKKILKDLLPKTGPVRYADHIPEQGELLMSEVRKLGVEGIVGKKADSRYIGGRHAHWQKIRIERTDDFVIVGYSLPEGTRTGFGALHLAAHAGAALKYVGRVGTGFSQASLEEIRALLHQIVRDKPACEGLLPTGDRHVWVDPEVCCEVRYKNVTDDRLLRHPVFVRLREDKPPGECLLPADAPEILAVDEPPDAEPPPVEASEPADGSKVVISNPDKVFWPAEGYTKLDLIHFYRDISPWLLPYLADRPLVLTRYPDGIEGKSFFQKNAPPYIPDWVRTKQMWSEHAQREIEYFVCDELDALLYIANMASIPLHVWGSRLSDLQHPDWCILDLDPKGAPFEHVVRIAQRIRELCEEIELPHFLKTSGSTGLHVLIPLGGQCTFEQCRMLAEVLARVTQSDLRDIATVDRAMRARKGRVYIDFGQNGHGRLLVSPFCVRPLPGAPVSTPLPWDELHEGLVQHEFTIRTVPERMGKLGEDPLRAVMKLKPDLEQALQQLLAKMDPQ